MNNTSLAMLFTGAGQPLEPRRFPLPTLAPGEVLVDVTCCTLCGSDVHTFEGRRKVDCPTVLGHEIIGRVAMLGPGDLVCDQAGKALRVGDRITWSVAASCGSCFFCRHEIPQKCERLFKYGHQVIDEVHPLSGGLAEQCHLNAQTAIVKIPEALSDEVACPANCATATVAAALRTAGEVTDNVVLVQGAGMLGLVACAMARDSGAREVIACDVNANRLAMAERFGATRLVDVSAAGTRLKEVIHDVTDGRGVDVALELSGAPVAIEQGVELLRIGGRYVLIGAVFPNRPVTVSAETIVRRLLRIEGVHNYRPDDLATAVEFLTTTATQYPFAELVGARFPLMKAEEAFRRAATGAMFRVAVVPE